MSQLGLFIVTVSSGLFLFQFAVYPVSQEESHLS
jgi:hypothetical protein